MNFMQHYSSPDLLTDHPIAIVFSATGVALGEIFNVQPILVYTAIILFVMNVSATFLFTYVRRNEINGELVEATVIRLVVYVLGLGGVVVYSNLVAAEEIRRVAFQGMAGVELLVMLGMLARVSSRFRPIYAAVIQGADSILPFDFGSKEVNAILDSYTQQEDESNGK